MLKYLFRSQLSIAIIVAVVTLITFSRVLTADFVMLDDDAIIFTNPAVQGKLNFTHIREIFSDVDSMMRYNPLTLLSWNITYHFWGLNPFWYHFVSWLLHGVNSALVFLILRLLLLLGLSRQKAVNKESEWITISAVLGALFWSLHPLRVEPVAWCTDRTYCQSVFFLLLSLLCYLKSAKANITAKHHYLLLTVSVVLYIISLLSYAIGVPFFLVLFVLDIYLFRTIGGTAGWWKSDSSRRTLLEKVPFMVSAVTVAVITICIRIASAGIWAKPVSLHDFGLLERFMQAMYMWAYYIWRPWYPFNLSPVYSTLVSFDPLSLPFVLSAMGIIGIALLLILLRRRFPLLLTLLACYLVLLVPVLGFFEHPHYPCDRYSLIASLCFSVLIAAFLINIKKQSARISMIFLSIMIISSLATMSFRQTRIWNNSLSLFRYMIKTLGNDPYSYDIQWRLAYFIAAHPEIKNRDVNEAITLARGVCQFTHYQNALALRNLAAAYAAAGKFSEAVATAKNALTLPDIADQPVVKRDIEIQLTMYEHGKPYIEEPLGTTQPN